MLSLHCVTLGRWFFSRFVGRVFLRMSMFDGCLPMSVGRRGSWGTSNWRWGALLTLSFESKTA